MGGTIPTLSAHMTCESIYVRYSSFFFFFFFITIKNAASVAVGMGWSLDESVSETVLNFLCFFFVFSNFYYS